MPEGLILKGVGGLYSVQSGIGMYSCRARGLFRKSGHKPLPGDHVEFKVTDETDMEGYLISIKERKNSLIRPAVANVDLAFIVVSMKDPEPDLILADKLVCIFEKKGIEPVICINKADLAGESEINEVSRQYEPAGYMIVVTDALSGRGMETLLEDIKGHVCVFAGQSGVGKSSLLNRFLGVEVMETGDISKKIGRGRHTTRHAQFVETAGGYIVDTPGFSSLDAGLLEPDDLPYLYKEFRVLSHECRFNGCLHINEPDCAVKNAVKEGVISEYRHERYVKIYMQAKEAEKKLRGY